MAATKIEQGSLTAATALEVRPAQPAYSTAPISLKTFDLIVELLGLLVCGIFAIVTYSVKLPQTQQPFMEGDARIAYPLVAKSTVSNTGLAATAWLPPLGVILFGTIGLIVVAGKSASPALNRSAALRWGFWALLALLQTLAGTSTIHHILRSAVGELRPSALSLMNYAGINEAHASGNWASFNALTSPLAVGSMSKALNTDAGDLYNARSSFPSGHACYSFAGCTIALLLFAQLTGAERHASPPAAIVFGALFMALPTWVSITRLFDNEHHVWDVAAGALLGIGFALAAFYWMRSKGRGPYQS